MFLIGESLNVISRKIGLAYKERDPKPIQQEALEQKEKGMDYIDINLGPAKKDGPELMPWVVKTVQEVVSDIPLALDTSNIDAIEAALKVIKEEKLAERALELGEKFRSALKKIKSPMIELVRGKGLLNAMVIKPTKGKGAWDVCLALKENGMLAKPTHEHIIRFAPPLVITEEQLMECAGIVEKTLHSFK